MTYWKDEYQNEFDRIRAYLKETDTPYSKIAEDLGLKTISIKKYATEEGKLEVASYATVSALKRAADLEALYSLKEDAGKAIAMVSDYMDNAPEARDIVLSDPLAIAEIYKRIKK